MGRALKDKAPKGDHPVLQDMMNQLKARWNTVCNGAVERQRELEEALLFSGQFKDALQALLDWLYKVRTRDELCHVLSFSFDLPRLSLAQYSLIVQNSGLKH